MDFLDIKRREEEEEEEKEMAELIKISGYNSEDSQAGTKYQADMNVTDNASAAAANYNINGSKSNAISIKNDVKPDTNLGQLSIYFREKWSFNSELKLGMAFEEENGFHSSIKSVGGAKRSVPDFIPRLDLSAIGSRSNYCGNVSSFRPAVPTIPGKQSAAQLTIFYGGKVNVYDDIPADKAQAIMLIARGGNHWNYSHTDLKMPPLAMKLSEGLEVRHVQQSATRKVYSDIPIVRKHSLQRFLANRKDRLNRKAKSPYATAEKEDPEP